MSMESGTRVLWPEARGPLGPVELGEAGRSLPRALPLLHLGLLASRTGRG